MRVLIQRVSSASVTVNNEVVSAIGSGLLVLLGVGVNDTREDADWLAKKMVQLRIFSDEAGLMNRSVQDTGGEILLVSQFTLHAETKKGNRPSYIRAARPEQAIPLYEHMEKVLTDGTGLTVKTGVFGADMKVALVNDGPVTIWMDTENKE